MELLVICTASTQGVSIPNLVESQHIKKLHSKYQFQIPNRGVSLSNENRCVFVLRNHVQLRIGAADLRLYIFNWLKLWVAPIYLFRFVKGSSYLFLHKAHLCYPSHWGTMVPLTYSIGLLQPAILL
jgi:hypothetical protein